MSDDSLGKSFVDNIAPPPIVTTNDEPDTSDLLSNVGSSLWGAWGSVSSSLSSVTNAGVDAANIAVHNASSLASSAVEKAGSLVPDLGSDAGYTGGRLEHVNIVVTDIDATVKFLQTAMPNFHVRGGGGEGDTRWVHVGSHMSYVALSQCAEAEQRATGGPRMNHIGFEMYDDLEEFCTRMEEAGYEEGYIEPNQHESRTRLYFKDGLGLEWEFVKYHVTELEKRNMY